MPNPKTNTNTKIKTKKSFRINNRLRYYRRLKGYKQKKVAQILGVHPAQISRWEKGKECPNLPRAFDLAILYRRLVEDIFEDLYEERREKIWQREKELGLLEPNSKLPLLYK